MKKGFLIGLTTGLTIAGASFVLANTTIQAILNNQVKVTLDGQNQVFRDETTNEIQYPITYQDRTYLPLRTIANLVGVGVDWDANTNTVILTSSSNKSNDDDILGGLSYDVITTDWVQQNKDVPGGYATILSSTFVNTSRKEMYTMTFSDVWQVHKDRRT